MTRRLVTRLALALAGAGLVVSGVVLLLRAGWLAMALPLGPIWASVVLGAVLLALGALGLGLSALRPRRAAAPDYDLIALITTAFLQGLAAGRSAGRR